MKWRPVPVRLDELAIALASDPSLIDEARFLDQETGDILLLPERFPEIAEAEVHEVALMTGVPEEELLLRLLQARENPQRFIFIEPLPSWNSYHLMEEFVYSLPSGRARDRLAEALSRQRPFRRFKEVLLDYPELRERWFEFQEERERRWALAWLAEHGLRPAEEE